MREASPVLIVRQRPDPYPALEQLVADLQGRFQLDPYTTRQRLLGPGLVQLMQGERPHLEELAAALRRHGFACWVVTPSRPAIALPRLRGLAIGSEAVEFHCEGDRRIRLERGMAVAGVLADLSGELAGQQVRRMLARNAYLGREQAAAFTPEEIRQAILKGQPVFDGYLRDAEGGIAAAFRVLPGRFNPEGLGGRAGLSAVRNLEAVIDLVAEYAGEFRLHADFGLSQLPGCVPQPAREDPAVLAGNLAALNRYGWMVAGLRPWRTATAGEPGPGTLLAAALGGGTALGGEQGPAAGLADLAAAIDEAAADRPAAERQPVRPAPLPPPPDRPEGSRVSMRQAVWWVISVFGGALFVVGKTGILQPFFRKSLHAGILPGLFAAALCWGGFACLRLKRRIEDTPTSRIRALAMGLVEVRGRATRRYALVAPMTQSACAWYRLRKYRRDRNNNWQLSSESDSGHVPFVLDDGSGRVVVAPAGATVKVKTRQDGYPGGSSLLGATADGGADEKWVEELICEGTTIYVLGYARPARGGGPGLRQRTVEALRRLKLDPQALRRYDTDGDGRLDADEWQAAHDEAEQLAAAEQLHEQRGPAVDHVAIGKPPRGMPFLIAEGETGTQLAGRYGWFSAGLLLLGVAAFGLALKLFLEFLRVH